MIYIQSNQEKDRPFFYESASAMFGAIETGKDYKYIAFEELDSLNPIVFKNNLFVGTVEFMNKIFDILNIKERKININSNRESIKMTLGEAREISKTTPIFVKPIEVKLFTGLVLDSMVQECLHLIPDDTEVLVYDKFEHDILTEYRCYIHMNKCIDIRNYSGDIYTFIDSTYLDDVISSNKNFPIAYTIDLGVLANGENVVIEYNDMWAIGNYGMDNALYLRLLRDRYFEIIKNS